MSAASLTLIIPALDEEENLSATVAMAVKAMAPRFVDYELIIVDDGSRDRTGEIAAALALRDGHIRVVSHDRNLGFGFSVRQGLALATKEFVGWLPSDWNLSLSQEDVDRLLEAAGEADFVLFHLTSDSRPVLKRLISRGFILAMNLLFGLRAKYYNGANFYRSEVIQGLRIDGNGYDMLCAILIRLLRARCSYVEVGIANRDSRGHSKAFRFKTFAQVVRTVSALFWEVRVSPKGRRRTAYMGRDGLAALAGVAREEGREPVLAVGETSGLA